MKIKTIFSLATFITFISFLSAQLTAADIIKFSTPVVVKSNQTIDSAVVIASNMNISGTVNKDVVAIGGSITLHPDAIINGAAVAIGGTINTDPSAIIKGNIVEIGGNWGHFISSPRVIAGLNVGWGVVKIASFFAFLILAVLTLFLFPKPLNNAANRITKEKLSSFLWGLGGYLLVLPVTLVLTISLIGIPLIPLVIVYISLIFYLGLITTGLLVGKFVMTKLKKPDINQVLQLLIGLFILALLNLIPILGGLIRWILITMGVGAILVEIYNHLEKYRHSEK